MHATSTVQDQEQAKRFLTRLDPTTDQFTFQTYDDNRERKEAALACILHGSLERHFRKLVALNNRGAGVSVTVNRTNLRGRTTDDIVGGRSFFADLDGAPLDPVMAYKLKPQMVVETSPGHWHPYWLVDRIDDLDEFSIIQDLIAMMFDGDPQVDDLAKAMRLPGFLHNKGEPHLVRLHYVSDDAPYPAENFQMTEQQRQQWMPLLMPRWMRELCKEDRGKGVSLAVCDQTLKPSREKVMAALSVIDPSTVSRADWIKIAHGLHTDFGDDGFEMWDEWSSGGGSKYKPYEMRYQWRSVVKRNKYKVRAQSVMWQADQSDPEWRSRYVEERPYDTADDETSPPDIKVDGDGLAELSTAAKQAPTAADPSIFELFWHGREYNRELRSWLVKDLIFEFGVGLASGQWGAAKTFTMLDLAASVMTGTSFAGREVVRRGGVLFVAAEGAHEVPARLKGLVEKKLQPLADVAATAGIPMPDMSNLPFAWIEDCPNLQDDASLTKLASTARHVAKEIKEGFDLPLSLIIVDTISATGNFKDANDAAEGQRVMNRLAWLGKQTSAFVMAVDHFGKVVETGTRGTTVKEASSDVILALLADREINGTISNTRMALRKLRGGKVGVETPFSLKIVDIGEGETTCIVEWQQQQQASSAPASTKWTKALRVFKAAIENALAAHGRTIDDEHRPVRAAHDEKVRAEFATIYPASAADANGETDAKRKAFKRALTVALADGLVKSREVDGADYLWLVERAAPPEGPVIADEDIPF
ncbi:AAA family ATPase [Bradyrhizobium diazoefficiens]|nr:AAA family ATPase [Bradyrhizobium diazoefficiens]MBR0847190.1 AAA family ATPase [Bradyrhizobium diazoefficiens]